MRKHPRHPLSQLSPFVQKHAPMITKQNSLDPYFAIKLKYLSTLNLPIVKQEKSFSQPISKSAPMEIPNSNLQQRDRINFGNSFSEEFIPPHLMNQNNESFSMWKYELRRTKAEAAV